MAFYEGKLNHLWVDLFVIDRLPAGRAGAAATKFLHMAVYGMAMAHRDKLDFGKYSLMNKILLGGLATVGRVIPMKAIFAMQKALGPQRQESAKGACAYYSNYQPISCMSHWIRIGATRWRTLILRTPGFDTGSVAGTRS